MRLFMCLLVACALAAAPPTDSSHYRYDKRGMAHFVNKHGDEFRNYLDSVRLLSQRFNRSAAFLLSGTNLILFGDSNDREAGNWLQAKLHLQKFRYFYEEDLFDMHPPLSSSAREGKRDLQPTLSYSDALVVLSQFHYGVLSTVPPFNDSQWLQEKWRQSYRPQEVPAASAVRARKLATAVTRRIFGALAPLPVHRWCVVGNSLLWDWVPFFYGSPDSSQKEDAMKVWQTKVTDLAHALFEAFSIGLGHQKARLPLPEPIEVMDSRKRARLFVNGASGPLAENQSSSAVRFAWRSGTACPRSAGLESLAAGMMAADDWVRAQIASARRHEHKNTPWAHYVFADWRAAEAAIHDDTDCEDIHKPSYESYWIAVAEACGCTTCGP